MAAEITQTFRPEDAAWDIWLARAPHDFYHRAAYHAFAERMGEGRALLIVYGNAKQFIAWPYLLNSIPGSTHLDATSVYGYTGPVGVGLEDQAFCDRAWMAIREVWDEQGLVTLFTRFHPVLGNHRCCQRMHAESGLPGNELALLGRSVSIDLSLSREQRRRAYPKVLRQEIQAAERDRLAVALDHAWAHYPGFIELYRATMRKNRAPARYLFSSQYFSGLREALAGDAYLAVAQRGEELAAALLFTVRGNIAQAHLTGVNPAFNALSPLKTLLDGVAGLAGELGAHLLHLGAGRGGNEDSLFRFKSRFSPLRHEFFVGRWILNREKYQLLASACDAGQMAQPDYFPIYRAPCSASGARQ